MSAEEVKDTVIASEPGIETSVVPSTAEQTESNVEGSLPAPEVTEPVAKPSVESAVAEPVTTQEPILAVPATDTPATEVDTAKPVEEVVKSSDAPKDERKAVKEKVKAEGKGFFAKFFGSKDKSPKKEKKAKSPKVEKADPTSVAESTKDTLVEPTAAPEIESSTVAPVVPEQAATTVVPEPPVEEASKDIEPPAIPAEVSTEAPVVEAPIEVPAEASTAAESAKEETGPKSLKASRRLSTRFTGLFKHKDIKEKKEVPSPKEETPKVSSEPEAEASSTAAMVSEEAPKIKEPEPTAPIQMEEPVVAAPPTNSVVAAAA